VVRARQAAVVLAVVVATLAATAPAPAKTESAVAAHAAVLRAHPSSQDVSACRPGYYENVSHHCVKRPGRSPIGATARCRDGTYSYSEHAPGTCSHHGGVARWIHHP
jgi:hypothetical protein